MMNEEEFQNKAYQALALADAVEVISGGQVDTYTHRLDAFEMARRSSRLSEASIYQARVWNVNGKGELFYRAYGNSEEQAFENLFKGLQKMQIEPEAR